MKRIAAVSGLVLGLMAGLAGQAHAGFIISATSATINAGGPGFGNIADTFNQNGLLSTYTSGVTDFDTYMAGNPKHIITFSGYEWFSNEGTKSAQVTYSLGGVKSIDALALWNEEASGIGSLNLLTSSDGVHFTSLLSNLSPTDNVDSYGADIFRFGTVAAQYVRFEMSGCPQPRPGSFPSCAIGEVAFSQSSAVPIPATIALLGLGLVGIGAARRKLA
jgi:hypothetical protein